MSKWYCIIPARSGSRRIPMKNIRPFHGEPMLTYAMNSAQASRLFDRIIVSSDDPMWLPPPGTPKVEGHQRSPYFACDEVGTLAVTQQVATDLAINEHDFVCCIYPCAGPFIRKEDLELGASIISGPPRGNAHVMAVAADPLRDIGHFYWSTGYALQQRTPLIGTATRMIPIPPERAIDINTPEDWATAERMYAELFEEA